MIFIGMVGLIIITYLLDSFHLFQAFLPQDASNYDKVLMIVIVLALLVSFYLKRSFLRTQVIVKKAQSRVRQKYGPELSTKAKLYQSALTELRNIYMRIWTLANAITVLAFVYYSLSGQISNFFFYSLAGLYVGMTTFPTEIHVQRIYNSIFDA